MTKWGRKKTPSSSISNHVFLKNKQGDARPDEDQLHSTDVGRNTANKISEDDDVDWKVSLEKGRDEEGFKILCNSDHKLNVSPIGHGSLIIHGTEMRGFINGETDSNEGFQKSPPDHYLPQDSNLEKEWQKLKNMEINEDQNQRKSVHIRSKHGPKVRTYNSPRTDDKMISDVKKPWMKMKKDRRVVEDAFSTDFDSFAIVKTSYNPQKDFRESMTEMIMEKQLKKREELEELLACYLTLNCDGFHDLIVNVFRQVWFELNQLHFDQHMEF
ncbi:transcription repressor OFP3-like [Cynara cardunculus var. scolymus]|uniref:transcription repressor OFP3-like n=1 Tax=Cynara cardunculus var. scolymus TaxID=59895 RepID=UPI000D624E23|nr:transcription repressor OFP3-like [Cynara cardunculus var. scolymus]